MKLFLENNQLYQADLECISLNTPWKKLIGKSIAVTGSTGLLGSQIIDFLIFLNKNYKADISIYALGRIEEKIRKRFENNSSLKRFQVLKYDLFDSFPDIQVDYIIHCAGNSHPKLFADDPIGTIMGNILGTNAILKHSVHNDATVLLLSSGEIYGENVNTTVSMTEKYTGNLDLSNSRSCYSEGKRAMESLGQSYITQYGAKVKIVRPCRIFGPTMSENDNKASAQFLKNALKGSDIILKSMGTQIFSYIYSADAVSALFTVLLRGKIGEAYNISNETCNIMLKDLAYLIAQKSNVNVVFDIVGEPGGSKINNALLDNSKLKSLGWIGQYDIKKAVEHTLKILTGRL